MYSFEITEDPEYFKEPDNDHNHYNNIEDVFDLIIHWDIIIDKVQQYTCNN